LAARPSDLTAILGQALDEILREEICTPRQVDCGHQILFSRLLCLLLKSLNALDDLRLFGIQVLARHRSQDLFHSVQAFFQFPVIGTQLIGREDLP
jgi:hypothetical protein